MRIDLALDPILLGLLACADCRHSLSERDESLVCTSCGRQYEIWDGIPALYPLNMDQTHFAEEEHLAVKRTGEPMRARQFRAAQWHLSKKEFWAMVEDRICAESGGRMPVGKTMINVGCGDDAGFRPFQDAGLVFVNFDLICSKVSHLRNVEGAKLCVLGDIGSMPFADLSFDYLVSIDVVHHEWEKLEQILCSFSDLIKPGGMLFLQDPNAFAVFQLAKSVLFPKPVHRALRKAYHKVRHSAYKPADYEFPTNMRSVMRLLERIGFREIKVYGSYSYPCTGPFRYHIYRILSRSRYIRTYHNYHYTISAVKPSA